MTDRINRMALRQSMIQALDQISHEAMIFADFLRRQQQGEMDGTPLAITTYYGTMDGYFRKYEALCHTYQRENK